MAATGTPTTNLGLRCPLGTDPASVDDINYNSGVIDEKMGAVGNTSVQAQLDALNSNFTDFEIINVLNQIAAVYTGINTNDSRIILVRMNGNLKAFNFHFKASGGISSGAVDLSGIIPASATEVYCALASIDGITGFAQYSGNTLYIRTSGGGANYICGQLVFR